MSLRVHHLDRSRSLRVLWLVEELGWEAEVVRHARTAAMRAPASLKAVHPLGKAPLVERDGQVLAETGAIVEALARGTDLRPDDDAVTFWLHHAEGTAMPPLVFTLSLSEAPKRAPALLRPLVRRVTEGLRDGFAGPEARAHADFWEATLAQGDWFAAGRFTVADVMMSFPVEMSALRLGLDGRPATRAWLQRIHARPAYARALRHEPDYPGATAGD